MGFSQQLQQAQKRFEAKHDKRAQGNLHIDALRKILQEGGTSAPKVLRDNVVVIDGNNALWRAFFVGPGLLGAVYAFLRQLRSYIDKFQAKRCYVCWDGKFGSRRRKELYPEYKRARTEGLDDEHKLQRQSVYGDQMPLLRKLLAFLSVIQIEHPDLEADDVMASLPHFERKEGEEFIIITSDKDLLPQVDEGVSVYQPVKNKIINKDNFRQEIGMLPSEYFEYRVLSGDASDGLNGVLGPKGAEKVIEIWGTIEKFLDALIESKKKLRLAKRKGHGLHKIRERIAKHEKLIAQKRFASIDSKEKIAALNRNLDLMSPKIVRLDEYLEKGKLREERLKRVFLKAGFNSFLAPHFTEFVSEFRELET